MLLSSCKRSIFSQNLFHILNTSSVKIPSFVAIFYDTDTILTIWNLYFSCSYCCVYIIVRLTINNLSSYEAIAELLHTAP